MKPIKLIKVTPEQGDKYLTQGVYVKPYVEHIPGLFTIPYYTYGDIGTYAPVWRPYVAYNDYNSYFIRKNEKDKPYRQRTYKIE